MTLWDEMIDPAKLAASIWIREGEKYSERTYEDVFADARQCATGIRKLGVERGDVIAAVITTGSVSMAGVFGAWFAGATVASLPIPSRGLSIDAYVSQLRRLCDQLGAKYVLFEDRFLQFMPPDLDLGAMTVTYESVMAHPEIDEIAPPDRESTLFIQFSSGTTGQPRGVCLNELAIDTHLAILRDHFELDPKRDKGFSWLPQSHDMGFFGALLAWYSGLSGAQSTPEWFLQHPRHWFNDCAEFGATLTFGPPSALELAARAEGMNKNAKKLAIRICMTGAEMVDWSSIDNLHRAFAPRGLDLSHLTVAYGMAEATLGITASDATEAPKFLDVDQNDLTHGIVTPVLPGSDNARRLVSSGSILEGSSFRIAEDTGEVVVSSRSLGSGYFGDEAATRERFRDGEFHSSDVGFERNGELFVLGRIDDTVIVGGRNYQVTGLELELGEIAPVRPGNCAVVAANVAGKERIGVVAELSSNEDLDARALAASLRARALSSAGLAVSEFVFLDRGKFPKTPSGKVQRYACREYLAGDDGIRVSLGRPT